MFSRHLGEAHEFVSCRATMNMIYMSLKLMASIKFSLYKKLMLTPHWFILFKSRLVAGKGNKGLNKMYMQPLLHAHFHELKILLSK